MQQIIRALEVGVDVQGEPIFQDAKVDASVVSGCRFPFQVCIGGSGEDVICQSGLQGSIKRIVIYGKFCQGSIGSDALVTGLSVAEAGGQVGQCFAFFEERFVMNLPCHSSGWETCPFVVASKF